MIRKINVKLSIIRHQKMSFMLGFQDFAQLDHQELNGETSSRKSLRSCFYQAMTWLIAMATSSTC